MRNRAGISLTLGIAGIVLGSIGLVFHAPLVTLMAAACAVVACFVIVEFTIVPLLQHENKRAAGQEANGSMVTTRVDIDAPVSLTEQSVIDPVTELPDARFFEVAVEGRVAAARRHLWPVSIVLLQLGFDPSATTSQQRASSLASFSNLMRQTLREADIACRLDESTFGLILEDTSEEGGVWTAERLQIALSHDVTHIRRLVAGVAAYPTHGLASKDVLMRAQAALSRACSTPPGHGFGQVEVAHVDLS